VQNKVNDRSLQFEQDPDDIGFAETRVRGDILGDFVPVGGLAVFDLGTVVVEGGNAGSHANPPYILGKLSGCFGKILETNSGISPDVFSISWQDIANMLPGYAR
jgi:hypothetical protein